VSQWLDVPDGVDGTWALLFDIQNVNGKKLAGAASAVLSNGRTLPLALNGSYSVKPLRPGRATPRLDGVLVEEVAKLNLKGGAGTVTIQADADVPGALLLQKMTAKIFGQTVKIP
jgi:hypothetical protein